MNGLTDVRVKHMEVVYLREGGGVSDAGHRGGTAEVTVALDGIQRETKVWINGVCAAG